VPVAQGAGGAAGGLLIRRQTHERASEAGTFASLEKDLVEEYAALVKKLNPPADETLIKLEAAPLIYKIGSRRHERE